MKEHVQNSNAQKEFVMSSQEKTCRYFRRGLCLKGDLCPFRHQNTDANFTPACSRGQGCTFFMQNRCNFYHPGVGVQAPKSQQRAGYDGIQRECRYKDDCWNIMTCSFLHPQQGFQFVRNMNRPPPNMNIWRNY